VKNKKLTSKQEAQLKIITSMVYDLNALIISMGFKFYLMPINTNMKIISTENEKEKDS
jgi:hypothetical protein